MTNPWEPAAPAKAKAPENHRPWSLMLRPEIGYQVGGTNYAFSFPTGNGVTGSSQLDWPLNAAMTGLQARLAGDGELWAVQVSFATNIGDPGGTLLDRDWVSSVSQKIEFSHTDSTTKARLFQGDITGRYQLGSASFTEAVLKFDLLLGYRHEAFFGDGYGITGWQLDSGGQQQDFTMSSSTRVGHYEYERGLPHFGGGIRSRLFDRLLMDVDGQIAFVVSVDQDNHVLRNKMGDATTEGIGFLLNIVPRWVVLGSPDAGFSLAVGANLQLCLSQTSGDLKQHYYADDPSVQGAGPSTTIPNVQATFSSITGMAQAMVDVTF